MISDSRNKPHSSFIEYIFINCSKERQNISSTLVKEKLVLGEDISALVPQKSIKIIKKQ